MSEHVVTEHVTAVGIVATTSTEVSPPPPDDHNRKEPEAPVPVIVIIPPVVSRTDRLMSFLPSLPELRRFGWLLMASITGLACYHAARLKFYDTRDYYAYQGTVGPYEYVEVDGVASLGRPVTTIQPGQRIAWKTDFCTGRNVSLAVDFELVRLAEAGTPEVVIDRRHSVVTPLAHRCGPAVNSWLILADSVPGVYEVRRTIVIREGVWIPFFGVMFRLAETIDPVRVIVSYTAQPVMPNSQSQVIPEHSVYRYSIRNVPHY